MPLPADEDPTPPERPRTKRCGWCKSSGLHLNGRGELESHRVPGRTLRCRGYETFLAEDTREQY